MKKTVRPLLLTFLIDLLNSRKTVYLGLITLLASGCTLGPDFVRPKSPDVKSYLPEKPLTKNTRS